MEVKSYEHPRPLNRLIRDCREKIQFPSIVKTAAEHGWFATGSLITRLDDKECHIFKEILQKLKINPNRIRTLPVVKILSKTLGPGISAVESHPRLTEFPYHPSVVRMANLFHESLWVRSWMLATIMERHPNASLHMSSWYRAEDKPILVAERTNIVGMITPYNILPIPAPPPRNLNDDY